MVAFSNLNGSHTQQGGNDYHRSLSHGGLADRNDAPLQHHSLVGKEDSRRRAITEPHLNIPQSRNKHAAKGMFLDPPNLTLLFLDLTKIFVLGF